jgi:hypothetical protein
VYSAARGIDRIDATNGSLDLSVAQYLALGAVKLKAIDFVVLKDSNAALASLTATQKAGLAADGIDLLNATDDALSLTVAQHKALGTVELSPGDTVTLTDTGARLSALTAAEIAVLATAGIDLLDSTNEALTLGIAQYQALGDLKLTAADQVLLKSSGAALAGLTADQMKALGAKRVDRLDATDNLLSLNVAQCEALGTVALTSSDAVTLADTGGALAALTAGEIARLAAKGVDRLDATDDALSLTAGQYDSLGTVVLTSEDTVTLADAAARLAALTAAEIGALGVKRVDAIDATDVLRLGVAQYLSLGSVRLTDADQVILKDTGVALAALTPTQIAMLGARGIDQLDATDNALTLTIGQSKALGAVALTPDDTATLADSGAKLSALTPADIGALAARNVDRLDATNDALSLGLDQFEVLGKVVLSADDALTLAGTPGDDVFAFSRQTFGASDRIGGGTGDDTLALNGDYAAGLVFAATTMTAVERIVLAGGGSYGLVLVDANVGAGQTLEVNAARLEATDSLVFDGSSETAGKFRISGGAGSNTIAGGSGADRLIAGGTDLFRYIAAAQSTSAGHDTIVGFDAAVDRLQVWSGVAAVDAPVTTGTLSAAAFDSDLATAMAGLAAGHAALFKADGGALAGQQFLVVDTNGLAGYQAGNDLVVRLDKATNLDQFGAGTFV